jgi:hypothetical protein
LQMCLTAKGNFEGNINKRCKVIYFCEISQFRKVFEASAL